MNLFCPRCTYPLVGVEELGMQRCPECGAEIDFQWLHRLRLERTSPGGWWQVLRGIMWRPGRFLQSLPAPRYYVRVSELIRYVEPALIIGLAGGCVLTCLAALTYDSVSLGGPSSIPLLAVVGWLVTVGLAEGVTVVWVRRLLRRAGHEDPGRGAARVMFFASVVYVALALDLGAALSSEFICLLSEPAAAVVFLAALAGYVVLWVHWAWVVMLAFQAETRGTDTMLAFWAFANPGLALALVLPLVAGFCVVLGIS